MIRIVPEEQPEPLSVDDARHAARDAYLRATDAQHALVANLGLGEKLNNHNKVSYYRLKSEASAAQRQVERAQAVLDALNEALGAFEATRPTS